MFILYAVILGIIIGYLVGGKVKFIVQKPLKHIWLAISGFLIQILIFSNITGFQFEKTTMVILYGISYILILSFVFINRKVPGIMLIGIGIILNATVIFLNGGHMPASIESLEKTSIGKQAEILRQGSTTNNSQTITEDTLLPWLGDIFYIPSWMPFSNVFSIGDVLIAVGVCVYLILGMKPASTNLADTK
ncbi:MAG: DUF5317 domain-containing protein [Firmicutes bacterium]|nr:DUF5317 domain-containing protein [Bacillota bacterium]